MGKTTLLEFLSNCDLSLHDYIHIYKTRKPDIADKYSNLNKSIIENNKIMVGMRGILDSKKEYRENVLFLPVDIDRIDNLEQLIIKHFNTMFRLHNKRMDEITTKLQEKISKIFKGLDLTFNFSRLDTDDQVYFKNKQGQEFPASNLSTGEKTLLYKILYLALYNVKNKIILIDEPELSLHPIWQEKVLGIYEAFAKRNNNQIIIATHSPHIIGSAKNEYIRILREVDGKIEVINDVTAYGRNIQWVLKEVMGSQYTRSKTITDELEYCQTLLNDEKYNEVEQCINSLEARIGNDDNDIMDLRNSLFFERD
jgi:predicted ATP-binding protein involved in virulence